MKRHIAWMTAFAVLTAVGLRAQIRPAVVGPMTKSTSMAADAEPSFEVATIKPNASGGFGINLIQGSHYAARNVSLDDLVKFAYQLHATQVIGLPDWAGQDRYDVAAVMQPEGRPSMNQVRTMLKKLLADRFKLAFHDETRVLPIFVMTIAKSGPKMRPSDGVISGDSEHEVPGGVQFVFKGVTAKAYADFLQQVVVDRPVVDHTGLTGKFDFDVTFLPDETMFGGRVQMPPDTSNSAPSLFTALQDQLGLRLIPDKSVTNVLVIDHAEKPSEN